MQLNDYLVPHSHQSLNTFKSCLIKQGLKLYSLQKLFADFFSTANLVQMKKQVKAHLNSLFKLVIQLSVAEFHFVKPGLIKHVTTVKRNVVIPIMRNCQ